MIITFKNLGAIKETSLDLRPLTVIIGPNNSNKTYISYSIYGLWKHLNDPHIDIPRFSQTFKRIGSDTLSVKLSDALSDAIAKSIETSQREFLAYLQTFFQDSTGKLFSRTIIETSIDRSAVTKALNELIEAQRITPTSPYIFKKEGDILFVHYEKKPDKGVTYRINPFTIGRALATWISKRIFNKPFLLPAERNAFIITYKILNTRRYRFMMETQRGIFSNRNIKPRQLDLLREQGDIRYPEPIEDFLEFLEDTELQPISRITAKKKTEFQKLADLIEAHIQGNNKTNLLPTKLGGKEIKINVKRGLNIDLYNASSSIKQLAPLLLYLRHRAAKNDLLIIDEPEMNLHPESQAKLLEILAVLVNLGINVLLTTHSPYFMAHLNNLISNTSDSKTAKARASALYLKEPRAFLTSEQVGAYEMRDNKIHTLKDVNYGIRWDTLSDVSVELQHKFFEIYEKGESSPRDQEK
jgi:AAA15 family ATPase/GTPase